eukprot:1195693-Prorocentrum_minimum.AAC.12
MCAVSYARRILCAPYLMRRGQDTQGELLIGDEAKRRGTHSGCSCCSWRRSARIARAGGAPCCGG